MKTNFKILAVAFAITAISGLSVAQVVVGPQDGPIDPIGIPRQFTFSMAPSDGTGQPATLMPFTGELPIYPESILEHPRVGVELQLVDSQRDELRELTKLANEKFQGRNKELSIKYDKGLFDSPEAYMKELSKLEETKRKDIKEIVETVLLPFQRDRLQQLTVQARLQASGSVALSSAEFANTLNLTDDQKKRLAEKQQEMERGLRTEIRELRKKRQQEVVESVLTKEQLKSLRELIGEEMAVDQKNALSPKN